MADHRAGRHVHFHDYVEDDKRMARLFEAFVRNFYDRELHGWSVGKERRDPVEAQGDRAGRGAVPDDAQVAYAALDVEVLVQLYELFTRIQPELPLSV